MFETWWICWKKWLHHIWRQLYISFGYIFIQSLRVLIPGDPKKGISLFGILRGALVLTKLPTKHIFRFLIKSLAYSDKYFKDFIFKILCNMYHVIIKSFVLLGCNEFSLYLPNFSYVSCIMEGEQTYSWVGKKLILYLPTKHILCIMYYLRNIIIMCNCCLVPTYKACLMYHV